MMRPRLALLALVDCTEQTQVDPPIWTLDSMPDVECWPVRCPAESGSLYYPVAPDHGVCVQDVEAVAFLLVLLATVPGICWICAYLRDLGRKYKKRCTDAYRTAAPVTCGLVALLLVLVSHPTCSVITGSESLKP